MSPADRVTWTRAALATGFAVVVATALVSDLPVRTWWLAVLAGVTLMLDAIDGPVARRTGTSSEAGARLDMEVDAAVLVVLSLAVATFVGWWVLLIAAMRYLYLALSSVWPVLGTSVPRSRFRVTVAALQGVALAVALAPAVPVVAATGVLLLALLLLLGSFTHQAFAAVDVARPPAGRLRRTTEVVATAAAVLTVWLVLVAPNRPSLVSPAAFVRIPIEGLFVAALGLVLPPRSRRTVAALFGVLLGVVAIIKVLDLGFRSVLDRPFDPLNDWFYLRPGIGVLGDSIGHVGAVAVVVGAAVAAGAVLVLLPACVVRLTHVAARHRQHSVRVLTTLGVAWVLAAVTGLQLAPETSVASTSAATLAVDEVKQLRYDIVDRTVFAREITTDPVAATPTNQLLTGLRGKDVLLVFVESYGRVAVQDTSFSPGVTAVLDAGTVTLKRSGFSARSAFLTSPTFGAASWLAHSTLESGLWVNSQQRYDQLLDQDRLTLASAFGRAGWHTVFDDPAITKDWPEGKAFYHFDQSYDARNVGYRGPSFSYATMPDQYTLEAFRQRELAPSDRPPVMAEIDLVSSHHPWTPLPHMVAWDQLGDGSVFDGMPGLGESPEEAFRDPAKVRELYGQSIGYSLTSLISFVQTYPDPDLVMIVLGDHQPHSYVTGSNPGHDVPVSVIAHDPKVMKRIAGWGWDDGLHPGPDAPVATMNTFRDRFLTAFGPTAPSG